jgi:predicted ribosomally synthesized peptide with nif11-like leader
MPSEALIVRFKRFDWNGISELFLMSEEQLKEFLEKVKADTSLQEKLKAAADTGAALAIAKEAGFSISADDLKNAQSEVSEEELENVAGGFRLKCQAKWFTFYECSKAEV